MTQASLSPDLSGALGASPSTDSPARTGQISESALWIMALTASGLLVAAVLLVGVLSRSVVTDASFGGFVSGVSIMIAALGVGALTYVLVTFRRQGLLRANDRTQASTRVAPSGMHVVPARPAEMGRRKRRQLQAERSVRSRQAKAIASATPAPTKARPVARAQARPVAPPVPKRPATAPRPVVAARPAPRQAVAIRPNPGPAPAGLRMPQSTPARTARPVPSRAVPARPAIRMPRPRQPRPGAWPRRAPVVRMAPPPAMPRTQVLMHQINAANVRMQAPSVPR